MRKFQLLFALIVLLCATLFVSCNDAPVEPVDTTTKVELTPSEVSVGYEGGVVSVDYTIVNGLAAIDIVATTNAEWISELKPDGEKLSFKVAYNGAAESRSTAVTIKYPNAENVKLQVVQSGFEGVTFQMEISDKTTTTCKSKVIPSDPEVPYIVYLADLDYFYTAGITNEEELFMDDYNYFMGLAKQYDVDMIKEFLVMNEMAFVGESNITWTSMTPDKEYILYAYAIEINEDNTDYSLASPIAYTKFSLSSADLREVEFSVNISVDGPKATYDIKPIEWDGKYYLEIFEEGEYMYRTGEGILDDDYARVVSNTWMSMITVYMQSGYSANQLYEYMCLQGDDTYDEMLKAATNYAMILYTIEMVDGLPQVTSKPYLVNFCTEEVKQSDMQIDIKVENNYVRVADVTVTPSANEPYTVALVAKSEVPESSNAEIIQWLVDNFSMSIYEQPIFSHINTLKPDTEYSVMAFGYYGGTVTTDLFRADFSTEAEGECQNSVVNVMWDGPYSLVELERAEPDLYYNYGMFETLGWYAMWSEIETAEPTEDMFYCIYRADRFAQQGEKAIFDDLIQYASPKVQLLTGENNALYVMCAVVMDYKGNYSDMWVSEPFMYEYTESTKRPIDELLDKLAEGN